MRFLVLLICFLLLLFIKIKGQNSLYRSEYSFLFYNTENFFDTANDSVANDDDFTSEGNRHWTFPRMQTKAEKLSKVILAAGKWNAPVLVGLCEIENLGVLEMLCRNEPLARFHYKIVQQDSPDSRGIDVALLYRPDFFHPFDYKAISVVDPADKSFKTRDILQVSGIINGCDTIHIFVNHWPSRAGGIMESRKLRFLAAGTLKKSILSLLSQYPNAKIVCMGDFNDTPADESLTDKLGAVFADTPAAKGELINLSFSWMSDEIQTIKSKYQWETFDQVIVTDYFLEDTVCCKYLKAKVFQADFLLEPDSRFGGCKPRRTFVGYKYNNGFSDHLPVLLQVNLLNH